MTVRGSQPGSAPDSDASAGAAIAPLLSQSFLQSVVETANEGIWMIDLHSRTVFANDRMAKLLGTTPAAMMGRPVPEFCFPEDIPRARSVIAANFEGRSEEFEFRFRRPDGSEVPVLAGTAPLRDENGRINGSLGMFSDLTSRKAAELALAKSGQEAAEAALRLANQVAELNALYDSAPIGLAFFDRDYRYVRINNELAGINGVTVDDHAGRTLREILPVNATQVEPVIDRVFATGKPVRDLEVTGETPQQPGVERHWLTGFYPVSGPDGTVEAVGAWVVEISERKAAEQREVLLAREVDHRAKNLLAVVQSIVTLTPVPEGAGGADLKTSVVGRIQALARAHSLLSDSRWDGVDFGALVAEELAPFALRARHRIQTSGPSLKLRPAAAQSLALVLHELATNAAKYGALSVDSGQLRVEWYREQDEAATWLVIEWAESGGPAVSQPESFSFGSDIIRASVERQLRGKVTKDWRPAGLLCTMRVPAVEAVPGNES